MPKETTKDLKQFLKPFPKEVQSTALWLREFVWDIYPDCNELIYDNYNAVAWGWSLSDKLGDTFCSIAVGRTSYNVHFGFYHGAKIADPGKRLLGQGNQYRYILVPDRAKFPKAYIKKLLKEAYANAIGKLKARKHAVKGITVVKSVSAKKRPIK